MEEFHGQFKIGGGKKKGVLLDWRGNEKKKKKKKLAHVVQGKLYTGEVILCTRYD